MDREAILTLKEKLETISDTLYSGETTKGIASMSMVIPELANVADGIKDDELKGRYMNDVLIPALEAMENKDGLLLADVISYELSDILDEL
ncbi:MAG: hypothetical protein IJX12_05235 [Lachnospiraceae bacterium]|nr:hypothetical protein [Lachnospiraceae bacterium]